MSVPLTLLGLLEREPSHGYDLKRDYDAFFGRGKQLPFGQVYATLGRLARDGKVTAGDAEPGDGPDRKRYAITDAGRHEVDTWLAEPVEPEPHLQTVLFAKVTLALMLGKPAVGLPRHAARRAYPAHARAHRAQADRPAGRRAARRPCPLPPGGGPPVDRPHVSPAGGTSRGGNEPMNTPAVPASVSRGSLIEARGICQVVRPDPRAARRERDRRPGRDLRDHGPERVGQVHPAALPGRDLHPGPGRRAVRRPGAEHDERGRPHQAAAHRVRVRVPVRSARARAHRRRQRGAAAAAQPDQAQVGLQDRRHLARQARHRRQGRPADRRAVRRRGPAGRGGPGARARPEGDLRRRADRLARLADRREGNGPDDRARPASRAPRSSSSPTTRGSPRTPTGWPWSATAIVSAVRPSPTVPASPATAAKGVD